MQNKFTSLLSLVAILVFATSCSTYDRVAVWYKYRNDFRAHNVNTNRLASAAQTPAQAAETQNADAPVLLATASTSADVAIAEGAAQPASKALAAALVTAKAPVSSTEISTSSARPEKISFRQALKIKKALKQAAAPQEGGKKQLIALILAFFLGGLGIHRFYLGYTWQGVVQLLTLGGCGIWSLIDLIRIAIGDLKPKGGEYSEKL